MHERVPPQSVAAASGGYLERQWYQHEGLHSHWHAFRHTRSDRREAS